MKFLFYVCATLGCFLSTAYAGPVTAPSAQYYRDLTLQIRKTGQFALSFPGTQSTIEYYLEYGQPVYKEPMLFDSLLNGDKKYFRRLFWDRILVKDGSFVTVNGEKIPLTCVVVSGQDNRFEDKNNISPLLPEFVLKIFFVANDFSCQGPLKPGWPETG